MPFFAQLNAGIVVAVSELYADAASTELIPIAEYDTSLLGKRYEGGVFLNVEQPPQTQITRLAFLSRFTDEEAIALDLASMGATVEAATFRRYISKVNAASFIDLNNQDTINGVNTLAALGILTEERATEILTAPVQQHELVS